jgi:hypothetical protein
MTNRYILPPGKKWKKLELLKDFAKREQGADHIEGGKTSSDLNLWIETVLRQILVDGYDDDNKLRKGLTG